MTTSTLFFGFVNIALAIGLIALWFRSTRPQKEDPRLSKGLQLLQSKIAVLEDLSDRTDTQVKQLIQILEERAKGLSSKIMHAQEILSKIDHSVAKSLEVADIFQDKIPHEEIIERQNTSKYVQAAKLAHEGMPTIEIAQRMGLPLSEVEFIAKVNKHELSFSPEALPKWAQPRSKEALEDQMVERVFHSKAPDLSGLNQVKQNFHQAVDEHRQAEAEDQKRHDVAAERRRILEQKQKEIFASARQVTSQVTKTVLNAAERVISDVADTAKPVAQSATNVIKKVQFPRIDGDNY